MKPIISALLAALSALSLLSFSAVGTAQGVDLLTGTAGDVALCSFTPTEATTIFGIPSRNHVDEMGLIMEFSHHGFSLWFPAAQAPTEEAPLGEATVYAVDRDGFMGYRGHFLGTVANGTRREPVRRILRSARAEITLDEADKIVATLPEFDLEIGFVYDAIDYVTLRCAEIDADAERGS